MLLHRVHLDMRCREARRDLSDAYQLHATLCRSFCAPDEKCPQGELLWRLEPDTPPTGYPRVLVQSRGVPDWTRIGVPGWLARADPPIDLRDRLGLDSLHGGQRFRFRLRANPCVTRNGKRLGLLRREDQEDWLARKGEQHGFSLPQSGSFDRPGSRRTRSDVQISQEQMLQGRQHTGNPITIYSVLFDGFLTVNEAARFKTALETGIGHGKVMGLGLLSVVPIPSISVAP